MTSARPLERMSPNPIKGLSRFAVDVHVPIGGELVPVPIGGELRLTTFPSCLGVFRFEFGTPTSDSRVVEDFLNSRLDSTVTTFVTAQGALEPSSFPLAFLAVSRQSPPVSRLRAQFAYYRHSSVCKESSSLFLQGKRSGANVRKVVARGDGHFVRGICRSGLLVSLKWHCSFEQYPTLFQLSEGDYLGVC